MRRRPTSLRACTAGVLLPAAIAGMLVVAGPAAAGYRLGPELADSTTGDGSTGVPAGKTYTWVQTDAPGFVVAAPSGGVIVRWRVRSSGGNLKLRVVRPGGSSTTTGAGTSDVGVAIGGLQTFTTRMPIAAGDGIGVDVPAGGPGTEGSIGFHGGAVEDTAWFYDPRIDDGGPARGPLSGLGGTYILLNADVEPDADHDTYGDETQDACPTNAADHVNACPPPPVTEDPPATGNPGPGTTTTGSPGTTKSPPRPCDVTKSGTGGADTLRAGRIGDRLMGGSGKDLLLGGVGADCLFGGRGDDRLLGRGGNDALSGGSGADTLSGGTGKNTYSGGSGNDSIKATNGVRETVNCGSGRKDRATVDKVDRVRGCERVKRRR
jgi:Ca2+-binding RTX toxin-like protein